MIVARKDFPANDLRELVEYVKKKRRSGEAGARRHRRLIAHGLPVFNTAAGTKPTLVAYRGTGPAMNDLVSGHVDFFCEQAVSVAPQISGGAIKAYAIDLAFTRPLQIRNAALVVASDPFFFARHQQLIALAARNAVPAIYEWRDFAAAGG